MFLFDTNVVSELRKAGEGRAEPNAVAWLSVKDATNSCLCSVTLLA